MLKIMPDYASKFCKRVYITILIEQEYWVSQETRNDNILSLRYIIKGATTDSWTFVWYLVLTALHDSAVLCSADCCQKSLDTHTDSS